MNLEDQKNKILKEYSYSSMYKMYFEISSTPKYFPLKIISLIFSTFAFFFIISHVLDIPKLENESLYIFAAQVTIIALIFPIILTLIGILYSKKNDFDSIFRIYITSTHAKTLYRGSFIILLFYIISFFYLYDSSISEKIRTSLNATLAITFIDTIIVSLFFLEKTIAFTTTAGTNKILIKQYINSEKTDESVNIISIITNRINEDINNSDLNSFEKNLNFLMDFLDIIIITSTKFKDNKITSNLNKEYKNDLFGTKLSKIIFLIQKNIELAVKHPDNEFYQNLNSIYFYIFFRNHDILEQESILTLLEAHHRHTYFLDTKLTIRKPNIINNFTSSWYKWLNPYLKLDDNLLLYIFKNHLLLTSKIVDNFSKTDNTRGLDFICDCLSRWESEAKNMPNYIEASNSLKTIFDHESLQTLANLTIETKLISFYLIQKQQYDITLVTKYYNVLIKGNILFKTTDFIENSYSFENLDEIIFSYLRLLTNNNYKYYFNDLLEKSERTIEITGLMYGGLIPDLESRITNLIIKILLLNTTKKSPLSYKWQEAFQSISVANIDKITDLIKKLIKNIELYNDYSSLQWDEKKLNLTKSRLINHFSPILEQLKNITQSKFKIIQLDKDKVKKLTFENTLDIDNLKDVFNNSSFSNLLSLSNLSYENDIKISFLSERYSSKYLTKDYNIHLDNIFKIGYYTNIADNIIFNKIKKIKRTEHLIDSNSFQNLQKIYLRSCIFASPVVIFNNHDLLSFILNTTYQRSSFPYSIQNMGNNKYYKIGKSIFKYVNSLPENFVYILPQHIIENVCFHKITPDTLSKVEIKIDPTSHENALINVDFPFEVHLKENSVVLEIFIKKLPKL